MLGPKLPFCAQDLSRGMLVKFGGSGTPGSGAAVVGRFLLFFFFLFFSTLGKKENSKKKFLIVFLFYFFLIFSEFSELSDKKIKK